MNEREPYESGAVASGILARAAGRGSSAFGLGSRSLGGVIKASCVNSVDPRLERRLVSNS